jgi:hypothetical protein
MPEPNNPNEQSPKNFNFVSWLEVLSFLLTTKEGRRLMVVLATIGAISVVASAYVIRPNKVEISTGVGTVTIKNGGTQNSVFLLSPSGADKDTPWVATGIQVKKGDIVKMTASGRVHTSLRRLVGESQYPETINSLYLPWVGPEGLPQSEDFALQSMRNQYKMLSDQNGAYYGYGMLLAGVKNSRRQVKSEDIEPIGADHEFEVKEAGELVLTVNDIWLNGEMKDVYALPFDKYFEYYKNEAYFQAMMANENFVDWSDEVIQERARKEYEKRRASWVAIEKNKAWNFWYEDNIGSFSVSITVN